MTPLEASPAEGGRNVGSPDLVVYAVPALAGIAGCLAAELAIVGESLSRVIAHCEAPHNVAVGKELA